MNVDKRKRTKFLNKINNFDKKDFELIDKDFKAREFRQFLILNKVLELNEM